LAQASLVSAIVLSITMASLHKQTVRACQQRAALKTQDVKDTMADCLRQLLEFDDDNRRATLESLSRYVAGKTGECSSTEAPSNSNDSADSSGSEASRIEESLCVSGPPGLTLRTVKRISTSQAAAAWQVDSSTSESCHSEETSHMSGPPGLSSFTVKRSGSSQAAAAGKGSVEPPPGLEGWKPSSATLDRSKANRGIAAKCGALHGASMSTASGRMLSHHARIAKQKHAPVEAHAETPTAVQNVEDKADNSLALHKAFSDLAMDSPQEFASLAQNRFSSAAEQGEVNVQRTKQAMETLRLLRHCFEQQGAERMQKTLGCAHLQEQAGFESHCPGTAHSGQRSHLLGQRQTFQAPGVPQILPARCLGLPPSMWVSAAASYRGIPLISPQDGYPIQEHHTNETSSFKAAHKTAGPKKQKVTARSATGVKEETLRTHLQELEHIDCNRVILVRKINKLGFAASATLEQHYSRFGNVERVLVAHSKVRVQDPRHPPRKRPAGLGFLVMSTVEEAQAILDLGEDQYVMSSKVHVRQFENRHVAQEEELGEGDIVGQL